MHETHSPRRPLPDPRRSWSTVAQRRKHRARSELPCKAVARAADFLAEQVRREEPIYGVSTGFGSNADKLLGAHPLRDELPGATPSGRSLHEELQRNLIVSHAVCVGEPFAADVVRAMLCIRINTLLRGHSGIRVETLQALAAMLNAGIVPVVPQLGSVGASGDLAPLSHLAIVLLGGGEAFLEGERMPGAEALRRAGLAPVALSYKEGLALNNGTAQMLATGVLALARLDDLLDTADLAAAMTIDAFAGRLGAFAEEVHALRPHPGQVHVAARLRALLAGSTLADIPYHLVPRFRQWLPQSWDDAKAQALTFDIGWDWVPLTQRHGREKFYRRFKPFRGGKKHQPQDSYSLRCIPQVHGAVRDAVEQAKRVLDIELNAVTDNPLVFPDKQAEHVEEQVISAGHFHGMPLALAMSYVKAAIPVLASISERRLNKLVDPATNDGLPAFLIGNEDATESGFMIVQYTAAAIVNDLTSRAHAGFGLFDPDQRQRRGSRLDGRQRGAARAGDGRRPRQGAGAGVVHRGAGARPAPRHDQCGARSRRSRRCGCVRDESAGRALAGERRCRGFPGRGRSAARRAVGCGRLPSRRRRGSGPCRIARRDPFPRP